MSAWANWNFTSITSLLKWILKEYETEDLMASGHLKTAIFILCTKIYPCKEFTCNRKKFMKPVRFSRNQILRWSLGMQILQCLSAFGLNISGKEGEQSCQKEKLSFSSDPPSAWSTPLDIRVVSHWIKSAWTCTPNPHQPSSGLLLGMAWSWNERPESWNNFPWRSIWMAYHHVHHST